jgi:hypothetical protein
MKPIPHGSRLTLNRKSLGNFSFQRLSHTGATQNGTNRTCSTRHSRPCPSISCNRTNAAPEFPPRHLLSGLGLQLYLGVNTIGVINTHLDTSFTMTICGPAMTTLYTRHTTVAGVCIALVYFIAIIAVSMALQAIGELAGWTGRVLDVRSH